jgi:ankyrin repeat protein
MGKIFVAALAIHAIALQGMQLTYREQKNLDTQLHTAAMFGDIEQINTLIKSGANIFAADSHNYTALILAAWQGHRETCKLLVEKMLAPTRSQKKEICIFLGWLKRNCTRGDYYNLQNIFKEAFCKFCKEINAPRAHIEISRICFEEIKQDLLHMLL